MSFNMWENERVVSFPFGLPKCAIKTQAPPLLITKSTVSLQAEILVESVTLMFSSKGTFKSTRIRTFLFVKL